MCSRNFTCTRREIGMCVSQVLQFLENILIIYYCFYLGRFFENSIFVALSEIVLFTNLLCCGKPKYLIFVIIHFLVF